MENNKQMKNNLNLKKRSLQVFIIVFSLTVLILSLITLASSVKASNLAFGRHRFYIMKSDSQSEIAERGDLVIAEYAEPGVIKSGDKIVYKDKEFYYCDKVVETKKLNIVNKVIIAEKDGVSYQFNESDVQGKVVGNIHKLGSIITFIRTPLGIVFFMLFIVCLFTLLRILITYKKDEDKVESSKQDK